MAALGNIVPAFAPAHAPDAAVKPRASNISAILLRLAISAALIGWLLRRTDFREVGAAFRAADLRLVAAAILLVPVGYLTSVFRWRLLLRAQGGDARLSFLLQSLMVGIFFNNLLPSTIGGDAVRAWDTARAGVNRATAVAVIVVDRFVGLLALMLFAAAGLTLSGRIVSHVPALSVWVWGGVLAMGLAAAVLFLPSRRAPALLARLGALLPGRLGGLPGKISAALFAFQGQGSVLLRAFGWSLVLQSVVVVNAWVLSRALHVRIPLADFFLIVPLALFLMMAPVSINGIGVRESSYAFFFRAFGVAASVGVAVAWLDYGIILLQALTGGAVYAAFRARTAPVSGGSRTAHARHPREVAP
jgi:glycosyltransferase 2 family protein